MAGVGDQKLSELHVWSRAGTVRDHDREGGKDPQADRLPDGVVGPHLPRAGLGARFRGLLGNQYDPTAPRLSPCLCVEHLASDPRLADEEVC